MSRRGGREAFREAARDGINDGKTAALYLDVDVRARD